MKYAKLILALLIGLGMVNAKYIPFGSSGNGPEVKVLSSSPMGVEVRAEVPGVEVTTETSSHGKFAVLKIGDYGYTTEIGKPQLPVITKLIEAPIGAEVSPKVISFNSGSMYITEKVKPVQPPIPKVPNPQVKFTMDQEFYSTNAFYPRKMVEVKEAGIIRGHRLVLLSIYPISYNPVTGEVRYVSNVDVRVDFIGGNLSETRERILHHYSMAFEEKLQKSVINYGVLESGKPALTLPIDYLFIVPDNWVDSITPLVNVKKTQGYRVIVATLSQTGNTTDDIKNYIQQIYDDPTRNLTFVQLVGDVDQIPNWTGQASDNPATDLYYTTLEGNDYFPDVYIGRLSVQDLSQLSTVVHKIEKYEMVDNWSNGTNWAGIAYFMASDDGGHHQVAESTHVYCMRIVRRHGMQTDSLWYYYNSGTPVADALNSGRSLAIYSGHGGTTGWAGPPFNISQVYSLNNVDMLAHVESYACLTGQYTQSECFMEAWLRAPNGAITSMGSSVTSYWDEDDILQRRIFDEWFDSTYYWVAGNIVEGKLRLYEHYSGGGASHRYFEMYNLFGDPSTDVFTNPPVSPVVDVPGAIPIAPSQIPVNVQANGNPVDLALVTFIQGDSIIGQGYTDANGNALINVTPISGGQVEVHVIGHNLVPYTANITAISQGAYVGYVRDSLANDPNGNGALDAGEQADLYILARNYGNAAANAVYGVLSTSDSFVTVVSDSVYFGNVSEGDSLWSPSPYQIAAALNTPDQHTAMFTLQFHDANDSVWTSHFSITVNAPVIEFDSYTVIDTLGGNGNGVGEPGETLLVYVRLRNSGHTPVDSVSALITSPSPYLVITDSVAYFGTILPDSVVTSGTPYEIYVADSAPAPYFPLINIDASASGGFAFMDSFKLIVGRVGMFYNVEGDTTGWQHGGQNDLWHVTSRSYHSPTHSFYSGSESGNYTNDMNAWLMSPIVILGENAQLSFWTRYDFENCCDFGYVEISTDSGQTWQQLDRLVGEQQNWTQKTYDLSNIPMGTVTYLRFRQTSDVSITHEGWYIDDIAVTPPAIPPVLALTQLTIVDSSGNNNGIMDPGESIILQLGLRNDGGSGVSGLTGTLRTSSPYIHMVDSVASFGTLDPGSQGSGEFAFDVDSATPVPQNIDFVLLFNGNGGNYIDSIQFTLTVGDVRALPTGPDAYGYRIFEHQDNANVSFDWIEIDPNSGGNGTVINLGDDMTETISLPFNFTYYGHSYTQLSVCSNGWIALGRTTVSTLSNTTLPNTDEPNAMIAGVWDDLNPHAGGAVSYYYDQTEHYVVIEYRNVPHFGHNDQLENFEFILYDPQYYPSSTGDGMIKIQYLTEPTQQDYTIGLENETGTIGLTYFFDGTPDEHAFGVTDSTALIIVTDTTVGVAEGQHGTLKFALFPVSPNPFRGMTNISFAIPHNSRVKLAIYDITGRMVTKLVDGNLAAGRYTMRWDGRSKTGAKISSGVYFVRLETKFGTRTSKLVLLR